MYVRTCPFSLLCTVLQFVFLCYIYDFFHLCTSFLFLFSNVPHMLLNLCIEFSTVALTLFNYSIFIKVSKYLFLASLKPYGSAEFNFLNSYMTIKNICCMLSEFSSLHFLRTGPLHLSCQMYVCRVAHINSLLSF